MTAGRWGLLSFEASESRNSTRNEHDFQARPSRQLWALKPAPKLTSQ